VAFSRERRRGTRCASLAPSLLAAALLSRPARAYDAAVDSSFSAQLYQVSSAFGGPTLGRQRYVETLSLRVWDLQGEHEPGGPTLNAVARLRLDADFGVDPAETSLVSGLGSHGMEARPQAPDRFVAGFSEVPFDLMMAYVEGRGYAGGLVGFRLGRQYVVDPLGWWSFDGGLVRLSTPVHFAVEAYGGAEQRGGLPLSTSRFEADGVWRGDRRSLDGALLPAYLAETSLAPAYGFAVATSDLDFLDARVTYRKVVNRDSVVVAPFPDALGRYEQYDADRVSSEKVGGAAVITVKGAGTLRGNVVYDALVGRPSDYGGSVDVTAIRSLELGADAAYFLPTFDGDSIFNWFTHMSTATLDGRVRWQTTRRISFGATGGVRRFGAEGAGALHDVLGSIDGLYRSPTETATLRAMDEHGERGRRRGGDVSLRRLFAGGLYEAFTMASLYDWSDALRPVASTTSFTYVLGGGYRPFRRTRIGFEWEHSMSELVGHRFRALCTLELTVL
jgi:hypothetical protein